MNQWTRAPAPEPFRLLIAATDQGIARIWLGGEREKFTARLPDPGTGPRWREAPPTGVLADAAAQMEEYFAGRRKSFDLPLDLRGTPFQLRVWKGLLEIPFGETCSYGELAARIGSPKAVRAVGAANGQNPVPIVVPCHRVIGADGSLHGFSGGLHLKRALLDLEGREAGHSLFAAHAAGAD